MDFVLGKVKFPITAVKKDLVPKGISFINNNDVAENILLGALNNMSVLLQGQAGVGKTTIIKWLTQETYNNYYRVQLNGTVDTDMFVGKWILKNGDMYWIDGALTKAMKNGYWLVLEEINSCLPEILFVLNQVLDDDRMLVLEDKDGEIVKPHKDFRLFATMNPTEDYAGTKELNKALIDRFSIMINIDYPDDETEREIIYLRAGINNNLISSIKEVKVDVLDRMLEFANKIRKKNKKGELLFNCSTRQLINWAKTLKYFDIKKGAEITILSKADNEERKLIRDILNVKFRDGECAVEQVVIDETLSEII